MNIKARIQEIKEIYQERLEKDLHLLESDINELDYIVMDYALVGIHNYLLDNDAYILSKYLYKYGQGCLLLDKISTGQIQVNGKLKYLPIVSGAMAGSYPYLILSNSKRLLIDNCNSIQHFGGREKQDTIDYSLTFAFKYMILGQKDNFQIYFDQAFSKLRPKTSLQQRGHVYIVEGFQNRDKNVLNEGLGLILEAFRRNKNESFMRKLISYEATAYSKLALDFEISVDTSDKLIDQNLLIPIDVEYDDITEVYQILKI